MTRGKKTYPKIGDIIEIETPAGLAYAQYSHDDPSGLRGELIRVLPGVYPQRPDDLDGLAQSDERYFVFFSVKAAISQRMVKLAGHAPVPARCRPFPLMKSRGGIDSSGRVLNWRLFDGKRYWRVDQLTPEQERLSDAGWWNPAMLVHRITEGWSPADDVKKPTSHDSSPGPEVGYPRSNGGSSGESGDQRVIQELERAGADAVEPRLHRHYLYLPDRKRAGEAKRRLTAKGYQVDVREDEDGEWRVLASHTVILNAEAIEEIRSALEAIASELGGEYDGWEAAVRSSDQEN